MYNAAVKSSCAEVRCFISTSLFMPVLVMMLQRFLQPPGDARMVLICTDRASRGLDSAYVEHVVLFDFPRDPSEYVRRVGRTARGAGGSGTVSILVLGRQVRRGVFAASLICAVKCACVGWAALCER